MIGLLRQKNPSNILVLIITGILIRLPYFNSSEGPLVTDQSGILYKQVVQLLQQVSNAPFFFNCLAYILIFIQAVLFNRLINDQRMTQRSSYLPATAFILITALVPEWNFFSAPLIVNLLVILMFITLLKLYNKDKVRPGIFNLGVYCGISVFLYFPSVIFIAWIFFGLMVMRPLRLSEWLICLLGFLAPFYFFAAYLFITDQWEIRKLVQAIDLERPVVLQSLWLVGSSTLVILPFLIGGYFVQENLRRMLIQVRKSWTLVLVYLLFTIFIPFISYPHTRLEPWFFIILPFAAFHACAYLYPPQKLYPAILFWISVLFILASQYFH